MYRIDTIDHRIAEFDEKIKAEIAIESRILNDVGAYYKKKTNEKETVPEVPNRETTQMIEEVSKLLQLNSSDLKMFEAQKRAGMMINPCAIVTHSPTYRCSALAVRMGHVISKIGSSTASCTTNPSSWNNQFNPMASAYGYGTNGWSRAVVYSWAWYEITPGYPSAQTVRVDPWVNVNGYYIIDNAYVSLFVEARGYQYDPYNSWGDNSYTPISINGTAMNRYDLSKHLYFTMPVGANDPFQVLVRAILVVNARGSGSHATANFATGAGNTITSVYVNTNSLS